MNVQKNEKGFSIIEVVLVLAIAALIFLMVFIALPALQKSQRDNARKQDASNVASALNTYKGNKRGKLPVTGETGAGSFGEFKTNYVQELGQIDPAEVTEKEKSANATAAAITKDSLSIDGMNVVLGERCDGTDSSRAASVYVHLEASDAIVCTDS